MKVSINLILENYIPINPITFGFHKCNKGHSNGLPNGLDYYLVHYVFSGKGIFKNSTDTYEVGPDDCFVIRPKEEFYYEADKIEPWAYAWMGFEDNHLIPEAIRNGGVIKASDLKECFQPILRIENLTEKGIGPWCCGKILELFQLLQIEKKYNPYVEQSIMLMQKNISKPLSIAEIAKTIHLDRSYFSTMFTNELGISPKEYYLNLRIKRAETLLSKYSLSVSQVAQDTGFNDLAGFSKLFKKRTGVSPQTLRRKKED